MTDRADTAAPSLKSEPAKRMFALILDALSRGKPSEAIAPRHDLGEMGVYVYFYKPYRRGGPRR